MFTFDQANKIKAELEEFLDDAGEGVAPTVYIQHENKGKHAIVLSAEDGGYFADYYGEYRGGYSWVDERLEKWANDNDYFWEWQNPGCLNLYRI